MAGTLEVSTAVDTAASTSTAVIAITARWPAEAAGEVRFAHAQPERHDQRPHDEQAARDVERDLALLRREDGRQLQGERVHRREPSRWATGMLRERMTDVVRTPEEALEGLPDFPFASHYREVDGLRLAHLDEGEGAPVVFFHGEPTWSFLWRKVIPPVRDAGFRCIAPDLAGFGRSDKPTRHRLVHLRPPHASSRATLLEDLDLRGATVVVHDWGGPIGLRLAVEHARARSTAW